MKQKGASSRATVGGTVLRATVIEILESGELLVETSEPHRERMLCDFLENGTAPPPLLARGDAVLVLPPPDLSAKGCVLGRIGRYRKPDPDHVTVRAERELTLECGDASITLRNDGKVVTRATDIAGIARRRHRIKGGSVEIN